MNDLTVFENKEFGQVRSTCIDGDPWFVGKDVAEALGYSNPQKAIRDHVDDEDRTVNESFTVNGTMAVLINESGLYSLILSSKLPGAKKFKRWVTSEVLPALRNTGRYTMQRWRGNKQLSVDDNHITATFTIPLGGEDRLSYARELLEQAGVDASLLHTKPEPPKPPVDALHQNICVGFWTVTDAAKYVGMPYRCAMDFLLDKGFIRRGRRGTRSILLPTEMGEEQHFVTRFRRMTCNAERAGYREKQTYLTQYGVLYLLRFKGDILAEYRKVLH